MAKLTPYDRAVRQAHARQERSLAAAHKQYARRHHQIDERLARDLVNARILPGSPYPPDDAVVHYRVRSDAADTGGTTTFGALARDNQWGPEEVRDVRNALAFDRRFRGGGGAAPMFEIWL